MYIRTNDKSINVKFTVNSKQKNQCIIKLEKSSFRPSLPCIAESPNTVPDLDPGAPNCFIGGWSWQTSEESSGWQLSTAPVQQIFYDQCSAGLQTIIKPSEICLVGIGFLPEATSEVCNTFTGMPLACVNSKNQVVVHAMSAYPIGCAVRDTNVGLWDLVDNDMVSEMNIDLIKFKKV